jgi:hypothetical protein
MPLFHKFIVITLLFWPFNIAMAQDTIYTYRKQKLAVDIIEIKNDQIAFKISNSEDKEEYYLSKDEIAVIVYRDGKMESFSNKKLKEKSLTKSKRDTLKLGKNLISMNVSDVIFGQLTVNYERFLKSGYFSFKVPLSLGLYQIGGGSRIYDDDLIYYSLNKLFSAGADFYFYPFKQGNSKLFLGPSFESGMYKDIKYYREVYNAQEVIKNVTFRKYASILFQTGVSFPFTNNFQMSTSLGVGRNFDNYRKNIALRFGLNVGYRF